MQAEFSSTVCATEKAVSRSESENSVQTRVSEDSWKMNEAFELARRHWLWGGWRASWVGSRFPPLPCFSVSPLRSLWSLSMSSPPLGKIILSSRESWDWDIETKSNSPVPAIAGWGICTWNFFQWVASEDFWENLLSLAAETRPEEAESGRRLTHNVCF